MAANRTSRLGLNNLFKIPVSTDGLFHFSQGRFRTGAVCDKYSAIINIILLQQPISNILFKATFKTAPIFLPYHHLAIKHFNTWFNLDQSGAKGLQPGTTPPFMQVIQVLNDKTGVHLDRKSVV